LIHHGEEWIKLAREYQENNIDIQKVIPIKTNDVTSLILQKCIYNLEENGILQIILPSVYKSIIARKYTKLRRWLTEQVNIRSIIEVPLRKNTSIQSDIWTIINDKHTN
jgi:hypothetical protein